MDRRYLRRIAEHHNGGPVGVETLAADQGRTFDLTLFLGVLYHVEDPMLCLRQVAAVVSGAMLGGSVGWRWWW